MHKSNNSRPILNYQIIRTDRLIAYGLAICILLLYLGTRLQVHNQCVDCPNNAALIQRGELTHLFNGAHLIYLWLISSIYQFSKSLVPWADVFAIGQAFNSLMASLAVSVFYLLARTILRERWLSLILTLVLAFTYYYWLAASEVVVYIPAVFFYLLSLFITVRLSATAPLWQFGVLGVLSAMAILFHVFCGLMGLVVITLILLQREDQDHMPIQISLRQLKIVLLYGLTTALCVVIPYLFVTTQVLHLQTASEIFSWILSFREDVGIWTRIALPLRSTLFQSATGIVSAFLGSIVWVATPGLGEGLLQAFPYKCVGEELYLVRNLSPALAFVLTAFGAIAGGALASLVLMSIPGLVKKLRRFSRVGIGLIIWLLLYAVLLMYLTPGVSGHWAIFWLPIFFLTVGLGLSQATQPKNRRYGLAKGLAVTLVISLFMVNIGNILLQSRTDNDLYLHRLSWYQTHTDDEDLIISAGGYKWTSYLNYHLLARVITLDESFRKMDYHSFWQEIQDQIRLTQFNGGRVFVMQDVFEPELCQARYGEWDLMLHDSFGRDIIHRLDCFEYEDISICEVVRE
jgi:hypothetical protein